MAIFDRVLVGYDGGEHSKDALALGRSIADRCGAELVLGTVVPNPIGGNFVSALPADAYTQLTDHARAMVENAAVSAGAGAVTEQSSSPPHGLLVVAERIGADLIVVGSSPRTAAGRTRAGRKAKQLMSGGVAAVAVAPDGFRDRPGLERIGVGVDGSLESRVAVEAATALTPDGDRLRLIAVAAEYADAWGRWGVTYPMAEMSEATHEAASLLLGELAAEAPDRIETEQVMLEGSAPIALAEASESLDLLCLGSRGYGPVRRVLLGSVSGDVVDHAASAVLVCPRTDHEG